MNRLNATDSNIDLSWDEFVLAVEDAYLIEAGDDINEERLPDICAAYDIGMTPLGCAIALMGGRRPSYRDDRRAAA